MIDVPESQPQELCDALRYADYVRSAAARAAFIALGWFILLVTSSQPAMALNPPTISPATGTFSESQAVVISAPQGTIYYTTDGTLPTTASNQYALPIPVSNPTQIKAVAYQSGVYSAVKTVFLDVDPALAPLLLTGLKLRLSGTFGIVTDLGSPAPVTQWVDLSGANNSASIDQPNRPTQANAVGGTAGVSFDGTQYLRLPSGFADFTTGASFFLVVRPDSPATASRFFDLGNGVASNNIYMSEPSAGAADLHVFHNATDSSVSWSSAVTVGQFQLLEASYNGTNTATIFSNGTQGAQSTSMQTASNITRSSNFIGRASGGANYYAGAIAEVLVYSTQLTASQRASIESYFIQKYQLLSVIPRTPVISVPAGTLGGPTQVAIASEPGSLTFVTTDGTTPTTTSPVYSGPINVYYSQTVKAVSVLNGVQSSVATATYTLDASQWPAPNPADITAPTINLVLPAPTQ